MRIIAGAARGRRLLLPADGPARPLLEIARGALFNKISGRLSGASVLDVYAGTGAIGIEALSRGASRAVFVEQNKDCARTLRENLEHCGFSQAGEVLEMPAHRALAANEEEFDLIFLDPPYRDARHWTGDKDNLLVEEHSARALAVGGMLVFRLEKNASAPEKWGELPCVERRDYGRSRLCFFAVGEE